MAQQYKDDQELESFVLKAFDGGYNSYSASKLLIKDNEIPQGAQNVIIDDNGSPTKRGGRTRYGAQLSSGHAGQGLGRLFTPSLNVIIAASNTSWYNVTSSTSTALTGTAFTADKPTHFFQANSKLYGANNVDNLAYTSDGLAVTFISSNGNVGDWPVFYNQRLYMTNASNPDRIYYSNPVKIDLTANPPTFTGFDDGNMFNTDLSASPKKTAGYIILMPGAGVEVTRLFLDNTAGIDYLYAYTKNHGIWRIAAVATANADGSIAHTVVQFIPSSGTPSGLSVVKANNDQWFFDTATNNWITLGDVATFINPRLTPRGGRVKSEANGIATAGKTAIASGFFKSRIYFAYRQGSANDSVIAYDTILNIWDTPYVGWSIGAFLVHTESDGTRRFLGISSDSTDSYIYELETGLNDQGSAIPAQFDTKSTDCDKPGLYKRFGFIDVFYGSVFGTLTYQVFLDETVAITGSLQLGTSASNAVGIGSIPVGRYPVGADYDPNTTFATSAQNSSFRIPCQYKRGKRISVRFSNSNVSENFKINSMAIYYIPGSIYET